MKILWIYTNKIFKGVSKDAKDFLKACLERDLKKRYSAEKLLGMNWIKKAISNQPSHEVSEEHQREIMKNMKEFADASKF